jgi:hypothetical protein
METNKKGERLISVVRVIEYHGTEEWISKTLEASRIPIQGKHIFSEEHGCSIKSGLVDWSIATPTSNNSNETEHKVIPIPPGAAN